MEHIDWTECALIETVPGKRRGKPVIKGSRLRPEDLLTNREQGIKWLIENQGGITRDTVRVIPPPAAAGSRSQAAGDVRGFVEHADNHLG